MSMIERLLAGVLAITVANGPALAAGGEIAQPADADDQRIICKKTLETGSLVKKNKQCFTKAEWERIVESQRNGAQKLADGLAGRCGNNGGAC